MVVLHYIKIIYICEYIVFHTKHCISKGMSPLFKSNQVERSEKFFAHGFLKVARKFIVSLVSIYVC